MFSFFSISSFVSLVLQHLTPLLEVTFKDYNLTTRPTIYRPSYWFISPVIGTIKADERTRFVQDNFASPVLLSYLYIHYNFLVTDRRGSSVSFTRINRSMDLND